MKRKNAKKVCAFLLALMMAATLLPMTAFAAEENGAEYYGVWIGGVALKAQINLFYPCGYAWKASESSAYSEALFAYNGESYLAIKPTAYMATWTDGNGASYEKGFKPGEEITIPVSQFFEETFRKTGYTLTGWQGYTAGMTMPENAVSFTAVYAPNQYTVSFDPNGAEAIDPITVTYDNKYGTLPSSAITGLSGGNSNWYLVDKNGNVTDTSIKKLTKVTVAEDHTLFVKRSVLSPNVSIELEVPGGISDSYQYYIPGNSTRILTAQIANRNDEILDYTYQWYKDGSILAGETGATLTLAGNVADSGEYQVAVTATIRPDAGIAVTSGTASAEKALQVKILHQANTVNYDPNGGTGGPVSNYTGGTTLTVSRDVPVRENYIFQGWNTKADGSGETFAGADTYTFQNDNGNGGCNLTLYAQWKGVDQTLTYQVDGELFKTDKVPYGQDIRLPDVPEKEGYTGKWDHDGKNITADTVINAVYTVKKYTVTFVDEKGIYKTVEVAHGEKVEMPAVPEKAGYTVRWEKVLDTVTGDVTVKAVYTPKDPTNPQTGINSHIMLWFVLLAVSGAGILGVSLSEHKRKVLSKR